MKSSDVKNIEAAIIASEDLLKNGSDSKTYKAMYHRKRKVRDQLQKELGDILLVKSGGVINEDLAMNCAFKAFNKRFFKTIEDACYSTHLDIAKKDDKYLKSLKKLWSLRQF